MRLIDADAFEVVTYKGTETFSDCFDNGVLYMLNELDKAPTVDAEPVRHGHWIEQSDVWGDVYYDCSACGNSWTTIDGTPFDNGMNYCPNCGAKMDEEDKE